MTEEPVTEEEWETAETAELTAGEVGILHAAEAASLNAPELNRAPATLRNKCVTHLHTNYSRITVASLN
jgi:hypothetical protein